MTLRSHTLPPKDFFSSPLVVVSAEYFAQNEVKENKCLDEKKNKKPDFVGDDILLDLRRRNCSILSKEEDKLDLSEENNFKKYSDLVEEIDSCNRILKKTFLKKYQSDIDKYIKVSEIVTEDEVECFEQANNEN